MTATPTKKSADKPAAHKKPAVAKPHAVKKPKAPAKAHPVHHAKAEDKAETPEIEVKEAAAPVEAAITNHPKIAHGKSFYAVGRRKTAVTQVLVTAGTGAITINKLPFEGYFQTADLRQIVMHPMVSIGVDKHLNVRAKVQGGGIHAQAESMRHAISRALLEYNPESRRTLKKLGFLTRDPRVKERKKPGLKRARRAPQFSKR
jgi:small subunit ribosomal protein S9